jgi:hypothetical protein
LGTDSFKTRKKPVRIVDPVKKIIFILPREAAQAAL